MLFVCLVRCAGVNGVTDVDPPVVDTTTNPPVPVGFCTEATSSAGAVVNYVTPTANDAVSGATSVVCTPPSGSLFVIGETPVTCVATDAAGNTGYGYFTIEVPTSPTLLFTWRVCFTDPLSCPVCVVRCATPPRP
jgi:hypothetical protein